MAEPKNGKESGDFTRGCLLVVGVIAIAIFFGKVFTNSDKPRRSQPRPVQSYPNPDKALKASDKIRDWKEAPEVERLALCVGFAEVSNRGQSLKLSAMDFHNCIVAATQGLIQAHDLTILEIARLCEVEMRK